MVYARARSFVLVMDSIVSRTLSSIPSALAPCTFLYLESHLWLLIGTCTVSSLVAASPVPVADILEREPVAEPEPVCRLELKNISFRQSSSLSSGFVEPPPPSLREKIKTRLLRVLPDAQTQNTTSGVGRQVRHMGIYSSATDGTDTRTQNKNTVARLAAKVSLLFSTCNAKLILNRTV